MTTTVEVMIVTYRFRLKDKHSSELNRQARAVNYVWNYCNETQIKAVRAQRRWLSSFDLQNLTAGSSPYLDLHSQTTKAVCARYASSRTARQRPWLRFRGSSALGWVPVANRCLTLTGSGFRFHGRDYETMHARSMPRDAELRGGLFSRDAGGRWYINVYVRTAQSVVGHAGPAVGVDLGLKDLATLSNGVRVSAPQLYRRSEAALAKAATAKKTKRVAAIHRKIANRRRDFIHKLSNQLTKEYGLIVVGDVSPSQLARTRMAKSVHDASWSDLKAKLLYKSIRNGGAFLEVSERMTTQICSSCGSQEASERPIGIAGLSKRMWGCDCGAVHDRDQNAAINILRRGLATLVAGAAQ